MNLRICPVMFFLSSILLSVAGCTPSPPEIEWTPLVGDKPRIELNPAAGPVGTEVAVRGERFPPGGTVRIYIGEAGDEVIPEALQSAIPGENGRFETEITIPRQWPNGNPIGPGTLIIEAISSVHYTISAIELFNVLPGGDAVSPVLVLLPEQGQPGDHVRIDGFDFMPGTIVAIRLGVPQTGLNAVDLAHATAGHNGRFQTEIELPVVWPGSDAPVIEETLIIAAVDNSVGQTLAATHFRNEAAEGD